MATAQPQVRAPGDDPAPPAHRQSAPEYIERVDRAWQECMRNAAWVEAHRQEIESSYAGQWLCVVEARVAAAATDRVTLSDMVRNGPWQHAGSYTFYVPASGEPDALHLATVPVPVPAPAPVPLVAPQSTS